MIYKKRIIKELTFSSVGVFFVLLIILISVQLVNLLGKVANGRISVDLFTTIIGVSIFSLMPLLLCLTCFISVLNVLSRYWRDSEMIIWLTSGLSLKNWCSPVSLFTLPFVIIIFVLSLYVVPWVNERSLEYSELIKGKPSLDFIEQGIFVPIPSGVFFVDQFNTQTGEAESFFSHEVDVQTGKFVVTLAKTGKVELKDAGVKLVLQDANRYMGYPNKPDFNVFDIPKVEYYLNSTEETGSGYDFKSKQNSTSTAELWRSDNPTFKAALMWRLSIPLAALILVLLAIPLSYINIRSNKNYNIILAILVFFFYQNGLIFTRNLIANETVGFWFGLIIIHLIMLLLTWFLFSYRMAPRLTFWGYIKSLIPRGNRQ